MNDFLAWCQPLLAEKTAVTVALSGGGDSVCCLHLLWKLQENMGLALSAAHYNHQLRGAESDRDERFCRDFCTKLDIPLTVGTGDVLARSKQFGESVEESARVMRYQFLESLGTTVATAHTADDNLETLLMNLVRGTGLRGLCGIPPVRDQFIRPILCLSKGDVLDYLTKNNLPFMEDSTNFQPTALRNRIRQQVVPLLQTEMPSLAEKTLDLTARLREDETFLTSLAQKHLEDATQQDALFIPTLRGLEPSILHRCLQLFLQKNAVSKVTARHILNFKSLLSSQNPSATLNLPGLTLRREYDWIFLGTAQPITFTPQACTPPFQLELPQIGTLICGDTPPKQGEFLAISAKKIQNSVTIRPRTPGDALNLGGGSKTVKKRLIDLKIPAHLRDALPGLAVDGKLIALWKIGVDVLYTPEKDEKSWFFQLISRK